MMREPEVLCKPLFTEQLRLKLDLRNLKVEYLVHASTQMNVITDNAFNANSKLPVRHVLPPNRNHK